MSPVDESSNNDIYNKKNINDTHKSNNINSTGTSCNSSNCINKDIFTREKNDITNCEEGKKLFCIQFYNRFGDDINASISWSPVDNCKTPLPRNMWLRLLKQVSH